MTTPLTPRSFPLHPWRSLALSAAALSAVMGAVAGGAAFWPAPVQAQDQRFLWSPGPSVGPQTKVVPTNCLMADDGTISCDTRLVNPSSDTKASPQLDYFRN